jgi:hypothetical protein
LLGVVEEPELELAGNTCLGTVPEVDAIVEEGVVLGLENDDDEGSTALADVLAFGILIVAEGFAVGSLTAEVPLGRGGVWSGTKLTVASPP